MLLLSAVFKISLTFKVKIVTLYMAACSKHRGHLKAIQLLKDANG